MPIDADSIDGLTRESKFHTFRFILTMVLAYFAVNWYLKKSTEQLKEPVSAYSSLEEAVSNHVPRYEYSTITIQDQLGSYDPVFSGKQLIGYVHESAEMLLHENKEIGYIVSGMVYNTSGRKVAKLVSSRDGYGVYSFGGKKLGVLSEQKLISPSGSVFGVIGPKTAVLIDNADNITGIITSYDYSRKNL